MPVNKEELIKDLDSPEYLNVVKETLIKKEFHVEPKAEREGFLERYKTNIIETEIPQRVKSVHDQYDKDIKEVFGADRNQDEKSYDYLKRVGRAKVQEAETIRGEVAALKEQLKGGDPSGTLRAQLEAAEQRARVAIEEKEKEITTLRQTQSQAEKQFAVNGVYANIRSQFKKELPPLFNRVEKSVLDDVIGNSAVKPVNGNNVLVMLNSDGTVRKDHSFKEITVEDYLKLEFKDLIDVKPAAGAGSHNPEPNLDVKSMTAEEFGAYLTPDIDSKEKLMGKMRERGIAHGTALGNAIWKKYAVNLKK